MPKYKSNSDLPESVRSSLPKHGQEIYREAFNSAWSSTTSRRSAGATAPARRPRTQWRGPP